MPSGGAKGRRRRRLGLALAGGGPEGAVYEIGALCALDEALEGLDLTTMDVYVGVSAGAFVSAALANGLTPSQLARAMIKQEPGEHPFVPQIFFTPAYREWARRSMLLPRLVGEAIMAVTRRPGDLRLAESLTRVGRALPVGVFDNEPIRRFLKRMFSIKGRTDDFRELAGRLVVVATDLDAGQAVRFGDPGYDDVPISRAVQASTAFPGLYPPVEINGRRCVDGVLLKTLHASVALEHGAKLVICVNPLVPADTETGVRRGELPPNVIAHGGLPLVMSQAFRTLVHSRLEVGMAAYETRFPGADVLLFEPEPDEYDMFFTNIFSFSSRRAVAELAYQATRRQLRAQRDSLGPMLAEHGIQLRDDVLDDHTRNLWAGVGAEEDGGAPERFARAVEGLTRAARRRG